MPKCTIDGKEVEFTPGENLIEVAKRVHTEIPFFCYHPGLTVVAQCRMCAVEIEKMPKLQTACSTPAQEGMIVHTQSARTKQNQKSVMEFLLVNHPLDCPICDKAGECDLQDQSYGYGDAYSRYTEERRTYLDLDMGPMIKKNMNRCIHCTRCIRFGDEIAGIREMVAIKRGNNTEITTIDGLPLATEYAGNYADICPTGSLTLKDFRFKKRVWYLKKTPTVCEGCSRGCNMEAHHENNKVERCVPRENLDINKWWMCDEGRLNYHHVHDEARRVEPVILAGGKPHVTDWNTATAEARALVQGKSVLVLLGTDLTQEEAKLAMDFFPKQASSATFAHFGTPGVNSIAEDAPLDKILRRKSKTANLFGLEKLGVKAYAGNPGSVDTVVVVTGGRAVLPELKGKPALGIGVFRDAAPFQVVLPGLSFLEKDGTVFNFEGREQKYKRALVPIGKSRALGEIFMVWTHATGRAVGATASAGVSV